MTGELGPLYDRMTRMEVTLDGIAEDVAETKAQATATNGKVAELKADQIRREAFRDLTRTVGKWAAVIAATVLAAALISTFGIK